MAVPSCQLAPDRVQDQLRIFKERFVLDSQNLQTQTFKIAGSTSVILERIELEMRLAIEFDDYATFRTIKVDDVRTYSFLSSKLTGWCWSSSIIGH
jgi:hypothetical protein